MYHAPKSSAAGAAIDKQRKSAIPRQGWDREITPASTK
jgi:hypothetical protein